ncbi:Hypothetical predicted protein [Olea europaea subsp. europaea]|uniref:Uncharacterized protein n=1 Tax=Olea europaea subsp. europaea TaxID=158383 RepID=A0A8S0RF11_OLEEU|nr:Hypothetical predicted protein [Olea europaea subsp. europaea]
MHYCQGYIVKSYTKLKTFYVGQDRVGDVPFSKKIHAALTIGDVAIIVDNPTNLIKEKLEAEGKLPLGVPRKEYYHVARNAIINVVELASYD